MTVSYAWKPFEDLPDDTSDLTSGELEALHLVWVEQRQFLGEGAALEKFHEELRREWSIETGIVEGVYSLDRGTTQLLIERGIDASLIPHESNGGDPTLIAARVQDHRNVLEGLFAFVKGERALTVGYVKELHAALLRHQDKTTVMDQFGALFEKTLKKGDYKSAPNNPSRSNGSVHEYCSPEHVAAEMDRMIALHQEHAAKNIAPEVRAAWLHHVFTQIHPFEDGNGRVARAIATLVFLKADWFPLVINRDDKVRYIEALEKADLGDLKPLILLFTQIQKRSLLKAMEVASEVHQPKTVDEEVSAARARLVAKGQIIPKEWNLVRTTADRLLNSALQPLNNVAGRLHTEIAAVRPGFKFHVDAGGEQEFPELVDVAAKLKYAANLKEFHRWVAMKLKTEETARLVVSFHGFGRRFRGLLAVSMFFLPEKGAPMVVTEDFFQLNYRESSDDAERRFLPWLDAAMVRGLALWRQQL
jgi:Fic family protein